jgi:hypothetical protein
LEGAFVGVVCFGGAREDEEGPGVGGGVGYLLVRERRSVRWRRFYKGMEK